MAAGLRDRATLYRVVDAVGRWSMIDIFMLSILVALVRLGSIASVEPGAGATCFAGVVVITMAAAMTFDPRLMWDAAGAKAFGCKVCWCNRSQGHMEHLGFAADITVPRLDQIEVPR